MDVGDKDHQELPDDHPGDARQRVAQAYAIAALGFILALYGLVGGLAEWFLSPIGITARSLVFVALGAASFIAAYKLASDRLLGAVLAVSICAPMFVVTALVSAMEINSSPVDSLVFGLLAAAFALVAISVVRLFLRGAFRAVRWSDAVMTTILICLFALAILLPPFR